ncbi:Site-specific recombinase XerC [Candidatus Rhodobacter oscarellae]|uniref:Site-specific recombinase XerC n=1 Tax=Candidatus Rhodobacter oscarellae TaxID=1675527 RepID=A0A0J9H571_9RHOB|nr:site-specific integrase [Candidatus Rhodobacter lobularis]KMW60728.1 Site-specific recombinase XerC [Candidatus Rhodobacter lobularis]
MPKQASKNIRIKRKYLLWRRDAKGHSEASVDKAAASISTYERFLAGKDFRAFHAERARAFKRFLSQQKHERSGKALSSGTVNGILRDVQAFFQWLADQPGYKSRIDRSDIAYLTPDRKSEAQRRGNLWKPHPSPEQARHVLNKMPNDTVIQRRDRALVAFLFLTGAREGSAISVQLRHMDLANACVHFDGRGVYTKFGKRFSTAFFPIGGGAERILSDWIAELRKTHLFGDSDPVFPKTKVGIGSDRRFSVQGIDRAPWASASALAKIFKATFEAAGLPPYSPHRVRDMIAELARDHCRTPEDYKAWSQNMGHEDVLTTFRSYGAVAPGRQVELMSRFRDAADDCMLIED